MNNPPHIPAVSVVIPTYNRASYLPGCLESVIAQTFTDYEIIVVDDGSTDHTHEVMEPWITQRGVRYIRQENKGPSAARNRGLSEAAGGMIAYLDSDDLWPPDKLEWQVRYLLEHPDVGVVGGGHGYIDETSPKVRPPVLREGELTLEDAFDGPPFVNVGETLIRTNILRGLGGMDESLWVAEDFDLWLRLAKTGCRIVRVPKVALEYRIHDANTSAGVLRMYEKCELVIRRHLDALPAQDRSRVQCRAFRWLYEYRGERVIMDCKGRLRRGNFSDLLPVMGIVARLFAVAVHDGDFFRQVCADIFVPVRFRTLNIGS